MSESVPEDIRLPQEVFTGDNLPDDLKWIITSFKLKKSDPTVVLFAWHWQRVQKCEDILQNGLLSIKAALDTRVEKMESAAETVEALTGHLEKLSQVLAEKPLIVSQQIAHELNTPITESVQTCSALAIQLKLLLNQTHTTLKQALQQQVRASFITGFLLGGTLILWIRHLYSMAS